HNKIDGFKSNSFTCYSIAEDVNLNAVISIIDTGKLNSFQLSEVSKILSYIKVEPDRKKTLYIDISTLIHFDHATGIQRVVKELAKQIISFNLSYDCKLIYSYPKHEHFYEADVLEYTYKTQSEESIEKHMIDFFDGDKILFLDLHPSNVYTKKDIIKSLQLRGIESYFIVYDLLPISHPHCFVEELVDDFELWLETVACSNGALCISKDVKNKLEIWIRTSRIFKYPHFRNEYFHLGADFNISTVKNNDKPNQNTVIKNYIDDSSYNVFLMVGTVEPRKGHKDVIEAFDQLWKLGRNEVLVIVGRPGWRNELLITKIKSHPMLGKRMFWLQGVSDGYLDYLYRNTTCLILASEGEGFGLPLIEAAQYNLPIIARNIPVFREIAGDGAYYFDTEDIVDAIIKWERLFENNKHPVSSNIRCLTWNESAKQMLNVLNIEVDK
ncbi:glycosyltransferase family 4 protein, partial [Vibrio cholerae]